jgi:hypothetical protein
MTGRSTEGAHTLDQEGMDLEEVVFGCSSLTCVSIYEGMISGVEVLTEKVPREPNMKDLTKSGDSPCQI